MLLLVVSCIKAMFLPVKMSRTFLRHADVFLAPRSAEFSRTNFEIILHHDQQNFSVQNSRSFSRFLTQHFTTVGRNRETAIYHPIRALEAQSNHVCNDCTTCTIRQYNSGDQINEQRRKEWDGISDAAHHSRSKDLYSLTYGSELTCWIRTFICGSELTCWTYLSVAVTKIAGVTETGMSHNSNMCIQRMHTSESVSFWNNRPH